MGRMPLLHSVRWAHSLRSTKLGGRNGAARGFTLIELMVVVLIMGILAAVGLASFTQHSTRAKTTKALAVCRSIGVAQERYRTLNGQYLDVSLGDLGRLYPAFPNGNEYHFWGWVSHPEYGNWLELAPEVPVYTEFAFAVVAGLPAVPPSTVSWPTLGTASAPSWPNPVVEPWYVTRALGDLDGDGDTVIIIMTSFNDKAYIENMGE